MMNKPSVAIQKQIVRAFAEVLVTSGNRFSGVLDEAAEISRYEDDWWRAEEKCIFHIGSCDVNTRVATIFAIEAARHLCGRRNGAALELLGKAITELKAQIETVQ
jgi:hypothetical protein